MKRVRIYGTTVASVAKPQEMYKCEKLVSRESGKTVTKVEAKATGYQHPVDISWLPVASKTYNISPNIEDYVVVNIPILMSDIPNRNSQGFALASLLEFDPEHGCPRYRTFVGKGAYEEHQNRDVEKASGIILDATLVAEPAYGIVTVWILEAFCRQKNPKLASLIATGKRNGYSMGALATSFKCSLCGGILGPSVKRTCTCHGTDWNTLDKLGTVHYGRLHYHNAIDPVFFETSSVADAAVFSAIGVAI